MATDKPRFTITVPDDVMEEIENFRFGNRFSTRSEAILELIKRGLEATKAEKTKSE